MKRVAEFARGKPVSPALAPRPPARTLPFPTLSAPATSWACPASYCRTSRPSACWPTPTCRSGSGSTVASRRRRTGATLDRGRRMTDNAGTSACASARRRSGTGRPTGTCRSGTSSLSRCHRNPSPAYLGRSGCMERRVRLRASLEGECWSASFSPMLQTPQRTSLSRWCRGNISG